MTKLRNKYIVAITLVVMMFACVIAPQVTTTVFADDIVYSEWAETNSLPNEEGNWMLTSPTGVVTLSDTWTVPTGVVNLDLNGCVINLLDGPSKPEEVILIKADTTLNLYDNSTGVEHRFKEEYYSESYSDYGMGKFWIWDDTLTGEDIAHTVDCGVITSEYAEGIFIETNGTLNMYGGAICGNINSSTFGAGVGVIGGTFNMYGGRIAGNYDEMAGGVGVTSDYIDIPYLTSYGEFNMYDGVIDYNSSSMIGGGVCVDCSTFNMYGGKIQYNTSNQGGGIACMDCSCVMTDGEISYNSAFFGAGVAVGVLGDTSGKFYMHGGNITTNTALLATEEYEEGGVVEVYEAGGIGGGVFVQEGSTFVADGGTITENTASRAGAGVYIAEPAYQDPYYCVTEGTEITMADGVTKKPVEELEIGDEVKVFDHENGQWATSEVFYLESNGVNKGVVTLYFEDNYSVSIVWGHSFFSYEDNKYVTITPGNVTEFVGDHFYCDEVDSPWKELVDYSIEVFEEGEWIGSYSVVTKGSLNLVTNGMLSCGDAIYTVMANVFDFSTDPGNILTYDETAKTSYIDEYGFWEYSESEYVTRATYDALNLKYLNVALGRHLISADQITQAGQYQEYQQTDLVRSTKGSFFGGDVKIINNTRGVEYDNVCMWDDDFANLIEVGTGPNTALEQNGAKVPTEGMLVGVTLLHREEVQDDVTQDFKNVITRIAGKVTTNGVEDYLSYFFADSESQRVVFNTDHCELIDLLKITVSECENGEITVTPGCALSGETIAITTTADYGYVLDSLKVYKTGDETSTISVVNNEFTMPNYAVTIEATFVINKVVAIKTNPVASANLTYTGEDLQLITAGSSAHGTFTYSLTATGEYSATIPTAKEAGTYTVYWRFTGDTAHFDDAGSFQVVIAEQENEYISLWWLIVLLSVANGLLIFWLVQMICKYNKQTNKLNNNKKLLCAVPALFIPWQVDLCVALGMLAVVLLIVDLVVKSCLKSSHTRILKESKEQQKAMLQMRAEMAKKAVAKKQGTKKQNAKSSSKKVVAKNKSAKTVSKNATTKTTAKKPASNKTTTKKIQTKSVVKKTTKSK